MRIRIVQRPSGRIDGVALDRFEPGVVYEVNASIATYLMATGFAQAVADANAARVSPVDAPHAAARPVKRTTAPLAAAHERARKKR
jgi:hypothetical protein